MSDIVNAAYGASEGYEVLVSSTSKALRDGRADATRAVNSAALSAYWQIGRFIVEYEQNGREKAEFSSGQEQCVSDAPIVRALSKISQAAWIIDVEPLCRASKDRGPAGTRFL